MDQSRPSAPSRSITTLPALLSSLSALQSHEAALSTSLTELLSAREPLLESLTRLRSLAPFVDELRDEATQLSTKVSVTAGTAVRVGGRVRGLDEEMRRVREASERVSQVMELKLSLASLQGAIALQDWESATRHCARAMSVPTDVISGRFAETTVPSSESPLPPVQTLQNAREELLDIFRARFHQASQAKDAATTSRFFKLFPAIGWEEEGLEAYSSFVVDLVRTRAPASAKTSSPVYYITMLTSLFESIALIVDQHQPVVEKYYGPRKMDVVVARLLEECDRVMKSLVEGWEEERSMKRKLAQTANPTFAVLNANSRKQGSHTLPEDGVDPREIDKVLTELSGMAGRWGLFRRFLWDRLKDDEDVDYDSDRASNDREDDKAAKQDTRTDASLSPPSPALELIETCLSRVLMEDLLNRYYSPLEIWYLRAIIDKAHRLSAPDPSATPPITTTPDDVFYILKSVMNRLLSTSSVSAIEEITNLIKGVISKDYADIIKKRLDDVYKMTSASAGVPQRERAEKDNKVSFIIYLNDLEVSSSHMERLVRDLLGASAITHNFLEPEVELVKSKVSSFLGLIPLFQGILKSGIEQVFNQLVRPRLRPLVADLYKDITYMLDEESYSTVESQDLVRKRFIRLWDALVDGFDSFTEKNYGTFFNLAVDVLVRQWEKLILGMKFTELGAIRFDRDMRSVLGYLSFQTTHGEAREKFQRLQQISTLLNLDVEEDGDEFYNNSGINWRLSIHEVRTILTLRV